MRSVIPSFAIKFCCSLILALSSPEFPGFVMNKMRQLKVRTRLIISFGIVITMLVLVAGLSFHDMRSLNDELSLIADDRLAKAADVSKAKDAASQAMLRLQRAAMTGRREDVDAIRAGVLDGSKMSSQRLERVRQTTTSTRGRELFSALIDVRRQTASARDEAMRLLTMGDVEGARAFIAGPLAAAQVQYFAALDAIVDYQFELTTDAAREAHANYEQTRLLALATTVFALMVAIAARLMITRSVTRPLHDAVDSMRALEQGDLTHRVEAIGGTNWPPCCAQHNPRSQNCLSSPPPLRNQRTQFARRRARLLPVAWIYPHARNNRQPPWKRPPQAWKN